MARPWESSKWVATTSTSRIRPSSRTTRLSISGTALPASRASIRSRILGWYSGWNRSNGDRPRMSSGEVPPSSSTAAGLAYSTRPLRFTKRASGETSTSDR